MSKTIYDVETQYLTIAFAKDVAVDARGRASRFNPMAGSYEESGLAPLLVYSLVVPAYGYYVRMLVDPRSPESLSSFLAEAWSEQRGIGMPLSLEVKVGLQGADKGYLSWLRARGVVVKAPTQIKSLNAFERVSTEVGFAATWRTDGNSDRVELPRALKKSSDAVMAYDRFSAKYASRSSMAAWNFEEWGKREKRFCSEEARVEAVKMGLDWDSSFMKPKAKDRPRAYVAVRQTDEEAPIDVPGIKELVQMWPGGGKAFLKSAGVSKRDFDFWVGGHAHLDRAEFARVKELANISQHEEYLDWQLCGGYLLKARTPQEVKRLYIELSHGGDLRFAFEVLGPEGQYPALRFVIFEAWGAVATIILFDRGGPAERVINKRDLINLQSAVKAPEDVWETVNNIVLYVDEFQTPGKMGVVFCKQHDDWLEQHEAGMGG